jgi:hypothetical protein
MAVRPEDAPCQRARTRLAGRPAGVAAEARVATGKTVATGIGTARQVCRITKT